MLVESSLVHACIRALITSSACSALHAYMRALSLRCSNCPAVLDLLGYKNTGSAAGRQACHHFSTNLKVDGRRLRTILVCSSLVAEGVLVSVTSHDTIFEAHVKTVRHRLSETASHELQLVHR